jgi:hypothetical protein
MAGPSYAQGSPQEARGRPEGGSPYAEGGEAKHRKPAVQAEMVRGSQPRGVSPKQSGEDSVGLRPLRSRNWAEASNSY